MIHLYESLGLPDYECHNLKYCPKCGHRDWKCSLETVYKRSSSADKYEYIHNVEYLEWSCARCGYTEWSWCADRFSAPLEPFDLDVIDNIEDVIHELEAIIESDRIVPDRFPVMERRKKKPFGFLRR